MWGFGASGRCKLHRLVLIRRLDCGALGSYYNCPQLTASGIVSFNSLILWRELFMNFTRDSTGAIVSLRTTSKFR